MMITSLKNLAGAAAIAGTLGAAALSLACGTASAAPATTASASAAHDTAAAPHAGAPVTADPAPTPQKSASVGDDPAKPLPAPSAEAPAIPAHLIPGFTSKPIPAVKAPLGAAGPDDGYDGDPAFNCHDTFCHEVIDE